LVAEFLTGLRNHYAGLDPPPDDLDGIVDNELRDFLVNQYQEAATANRATNMERVRWAYRSNGCLIITLIVLGVSVFPFWVVSEKKPQKMEMVTNPLPVRIETSSSGSPGIKIEVDGKLQLQQAPQSKP
jgi:hypothetical protein